MKSIGAVIYAYYVIDAISRRRPLDPPEAAASRATWDAVRAVHLNGEEREELSRGPARREKALRTGARRYFAWVRDNPEKVAALRRLAAPSQDQLHE